MKRYFTFIGMIVLIGLFLAVGVYIQQEQQQQLATQEMYAKERHLVVYSDMPTAVNRDLAEAFYILLSLELLLQIIGFLLHYSS